MEISGTLTTLLEAVTGVGTNGPWKKKTFVIETKDKFPKKVAITAWNEQADLTERLTIGSELTVNFNLESREYNGKWYTDVKAWKIEAANAPAADFSDGDFIDNTNQENFDPLPF